MARGGGDKRQARPAFAKRAAARADAKAERLAERARRRARWSEGLPGFTVENMPSDYELAAGTGAGMMSAQTRIPPQYTRQFGCEELHGAFLQHCADCGGNAAAVILPLPEGEAFFDFAMKRARALKARVGFVFDSADQARAALARARLALPKHRPVSIERAEAVRWDGQA